MADGKYRVEANYFQQFAIGSRSHFVALSLWAPFRIPMTNRFAHRNAFATRFVPQIWHCENRITFLRTHELSSFMKRTCWSQILISTYSTCLFNIDTCALGFSLFVWATGRIKVFAVYRCVQSYQRLLLLLPLAFHIALPTWCTQVLTHIASSDAVLDMLYVYTFIIYTVDVCLCTELHKYRHHHSGNSKKARDSAIMDAMREQKHTVSSVEYIYMHMCAPASRLHLSRKCGYTSCNHPSRYHAS